MGDTYRPNSAEFLVTNRGGMVSQPVGTCGYHDANDGFRRRKPIVVMCDRDYIKVLDVPVPLNVQVRGGWDRSTVRRVLYVKRDVLEGTLKSKVA